MKLAVLVKHVPDTAEADLAVADNNVSIKTAGLPYEMNEWDRFALEEAVQLRERTSGELTAYLIGPETHEESLRRCLAVGADRAVRVWADGLERLGPMAAAGLLAKLLEGEAYDLILCGAQAADDGYALVGPAVAEKLGLPSAVLATRIDLGDGTLVCAREMEGGWTEEMELKLPALVAVQTGINEPRYVSILGIRKARAKPIELTDPAGAGLDTGALAALNGQLEIVSLAPPPEGRQAELWEGTNDDIAAKFVAALTEAGGLS